MPVFILLLFFYYILQMRYLLCKCFIAQGLMIKAR
jgi:hypothetical protein